jgi:hypothetical protein
MKGISTGGIVLSLEEAMCVMGCLIPQIDPRRMTVARATQKNFDRRRSTRSRRGWRLTAALEPKAGRAALDGACAKCVLIYGGL